MRYKKKKSTNNLLFDPVASRASAVARLVHKFKETIALPAVTASAWAIFDARSTDNKM